MALGPKRIVRKLLRRFGYDIVKQDEAGISYRIPDMTTDDLKLWERVKPFTMTSPERIWACIQAARYVSRRAVGGAFVECGVWRGGSSMAAALAFLGAGDGGREMWLYDTFEGMNRPDERDFKIGSDELAEKKFEATKLSETSSTWCYADLADVQANMATTGYPPDNIRYVRGPVEETLGDPANIPERIALLRLDTDWYESTRVELDHLFDRVVPNGVIILDDYGEWAGVKRAVDEFFARTGETYLLNRIDRAGRIFIKA